MVIKTIIVNQGTAYRRGMPKARGQTRPFRKFLSHIDITLGFPDDEKASKKQKKETKGTASQKAKTPVKTSGTSTKTKSKSASSTSSASSESTAS
jgi:hypothetical protein